jgi:arylsulfatase A-like enzyme
MDGLRGSQTFSRWNPLWGVLGIGLPLTFAGQVRPATMFLRTNELIPLYATEWIILAVVGLAAVGVLSVFDIALTKLRWRIETRAAAKVGFAIIVATAIFLGVLTWIATFRHAPPLADAWKWLKWFLFFFTVPTAIIIARGFFQAELATAARIARRLALAGSATLLSLPFVSGSAPQAHIGPAIAIAEAISRPNIVLITVDTLAADHLLPYGSLRPTSPNIAAFASQAVVFDQFHANSNFTTPGIASILTGVLPWTHRALQLQGRPSGNSVADSLPARLHEVGYLTAYFGSNPWAGVRRNGFSAYFDHQESDLDWVFGPCFDALTNRVPYLCSAATNPLINIAYGVVVRAASMAGLLRLNPHSNLEQIVAQAARWTSDRHRAPVFMWVHLFPPHAPYAAPKPWLGQFDHSQAARSASSSFPAHLFDSSLEPASRIAALESRYDESIVYLDYYFGKLVSSVRQNLGANTVILLTADHGESFDHGYGDHGGVMLYEDLIRIPLIVAFPSATAPTQRRDELASQIDLAPTIAAIAGVAPSPGWAGRSLLAVPNTNEVLTIFSMNFEQNQSRGRLATGAVAALRSNWKLVRFIGEPQYPNMPRLQTQLFDLAKDPREHKNLAAIYPHIVAPLSAQIEEQLTAHGNAVSE